MRPGGLWLQLHSENNRPRGGGVEIWSIHNGVPVNNGVHWLDRSRWILLRLGVGSLLVLMRRRLRHRVGWGWLRRLSGNERFDNY